MTMPRQVLKGDTYIFTRRCTQRLFLIAPSALVNQIILFCLAHAAGKCGIIIHGFCTMSNHIHVILTDPYGFLPDFAHWFCEFSAKCINTSRGIWENMWASENYSAVRLTSEDAIIDKLLYTFANPVSARLVHKSELWPGAISRPQDIVAQPRIIKRPNVFFGKKSTVPEEALLGVAMPPSLSGQYKPEEFVYMLDDELQLREADMRRQVISSGKTFMGVQALLQQDPYSCPSSLEPRRNLNPRVAGKNKWKRIEALQRLKSFYKDYKRALEAFQGGDNKALFPEGTYWMVVFFGANCVPS